MLSRSKNNTKNDTWNTKIKPNLDLVLEMRQQGMSAKAIAEKLEITPRAIYYHMNKRPEFKELMETSKEVYYNDIEDVATNSLIDNLQDRFVVVEEIVKDGVVVQQKKKLLRANITAIIFALKSRNPKVWDALGVARLEEKTDTEDINKEILNTLEKYKPNTQEDK